MDSLSRNKTEAGPAVDRLSETHRILIDLIGRLQSNDDWKRALDTAARFHRYSFANSLLIATSHARAFSRGLVPDPVPDVVAGFHTWKALGRHVIAGQHGHTILCPRSRTIREANSPDGQKRVIDRSEKAAPGETMTSRRAVSGWTTGTVFARSQTEGADLPLPPEPVLLTGAAPPGLWYGLADQIRAAGFELSTVPDRAALGGANGVTEFGFRTVQVRADMDEAARVKTLSHELAHAVLHAPQVVGGRLVANVLPLELREVEAESVAFLIGSAHGMPTTAYSLPYVASWAGGIDPAATVRATSERVVKTARTILDQLETNHGLGGQPPGVELALDHSRTPRIATTRPAPERQGATR